MKNLFRITILTAVFMMPFVLSAEVLPHSSAGVKVTVPDSWDQDIDGDFLAITDPDEEAVIMFIVSEAGQIEEMLEELDSALSEIVTESDMGDAEEVTLNGMPAILSDGTGVAEGEDVQLGVAVIKTPKNKALIVIGLVADFAAEKHDRTITQVIRSIKPLH